MGGLGAALLIAVSVGVCFYDIREFRIPNYISLGSFFLGFLFIWISSKSIPYEYLISSVIAFLTYLAAYVLSRKKLGLGDVKLSLFLGGVSGLIGWYILNLVAIGTGLLFFLILHLTGRDIKGRPVPFGPFLCASALLVYFLCPSGTDITAFFR